MALETILAAAQTAATSTNVTLLDGETLSIGLFTDSVNGEYPTRFEIWLMQDTPSADRRVIDLAKVPPQVIAGPGEFRVVRPVISAGGVNIGAFTDDGAA